MDTVLAVLPWILPPLLGAIIGYVTNRIAIKMLFRPLTPKRFLGVRVPLTPGVIPRNRFDLARLSPAWCRNNCCRPRPSGSNWTARSSATTSRGGSASVAGR